MIYEKPLAEVDFFSEIVGASGDWETPIDPDVA